MSPLVEFKNQASIVVFGASGDLAKKKTYPALFGLFCHGELPATVKIIGFARSKMTEEEYKKRISEHFKISENDTQGQEFKTKFLELCSYISAPYDSDEGYVELEKQIDDFDAHHSHDKTQRLFYLALPPSAFITVAKQLKKNVHPREKGHAKLIVEKPFGHDLKSARELQASLAPLWSEDELYRIDHYLGKEMVKNLLVMRFGNEILGAAWNKNHIRSIQITFKEPFGTEGRGGYFDDIGMIRDVIQNHLLQVLTLLTMERPVSNDPEAVRDEKVKVLKAFDTDISLDDDVLLGQYTRSADGTKPAYLDDETVKAGSKCVTYAAIGMQIHNERWEGVPIVLRAGKALDEGKVEIRIQFKQVAKGLFTDVNRNELVMRIQPNEAVYMKLNNKTPGLSLATTTSELDLTYANRYSKDFWIPEAYESLIRDCLLGNHANFVRDDELEISWKLFTPLLEKIEAADGPTPFLYPYGSRGPLEGPEFMKKHGYVKSESNYQWPLTRPSEEKSKI
ncbi:hypothetical protein BABINDRAFT_67036 [Babjeviella inositovora NRRL Y-12698]|uniref:Glucose-6-phosphate 1-dehydrogenase n=1 Tax=Babjeviella inositovora NRRL Y-12698 TaxID=984486 RepID=A0A1E3QJT1_9ASCO|nr:uncharacterized protein BABINDRAFT_67036 [Babjeviella inositovora NRRL Y-12698]ODQ77724.1 hypothetical protein BABINDRAFT_67036 [Babjeviella inositovora NRRL Y-12698]